VANKKRKVFLGGHDSLVLCFQAGLLSREIPYRSAAIELPDQYAVCTHFLYLIPSVLIRTPIPAIGELSF